MLAIVIADQEKARSLSSAKRMFNPTKILKTHQQKAKWRPVLSFLVPKP